MYARAGGACYGNSHRRNYVYVYIRVHICTRTHVLCISREYKTFIQGMCVYTYTYIYIIYTITHTSYAHTSHKLPD